MQTRAVLEGSGSCAALSLFQNLRTVISVLSRVRAQEIMVDYGGKYFERDSSSDLEMQSDDEDFVPKQKRRKHGALAPLKRARGRPSS